MDLTTRYLRPVNAQTGLLTVTGQVLSRGSRTALAEARLTDERDRLLAHATSTCMIFDLREPAGQRTT
ncbi:MAG: PaaI family thioesterase [Streptosporangiaceae bacterium]